LCRTEVAISQKQETIDRQQTGIKRWNSSGEYIKILHHDDRFTDRHGLAEFRALDCNPGSDFALSARRHDIDGNVNLFIKQAKPISALQKPFSPLSCNFIGAPSVTIFRKTSDVF
jgi:hypothetical protein